MNYCKRCVYPDVAVNLNIHSDGICSSCRVFENFLNLPPEFWENQKNKLAGIMNETVGNSCENYDCLIPVSGGKDSYYQAHVIVEEFGLKPLFVTYNGNNFLPEGDYNRDRMREVFDGDHIVWGPSVEVLKKLNRLAFKKMGDMNWQNHCGILTAPIIVAEKFKIPLIVWGETNWDVSGMFDVEDCVEFSARVRYEHSLRGYSWEEFVGDPQDELTQKDMIWSRYPSDEEILRVGIRGIFLGNFFKWNPKQHVDMIKEHYGWKAADEPFQRTYRNFSNLDDRYENGVHDLMKFVKFGYGRCSDHASKDIRMGDMTRDEGIELVRAYDHVVSKDLFHWLDYVRMSEDEFWHIADGFRSANVWNIQDGLWWKENIWGGISSYGPVNLDKNERARFQDYSSEWAG